MADSVKLLPVTLPAWPACEDCLSWSEDDLAVATGESVHVLTPKVSSKPTGAPGHPQWHIHNIRTNQFRQDEWPEQVLATTQQFSLGEEQSNSHVVALAWSFAGIGVHRRSVLGVLTSNLILSIWETDGRQAHFRRTCVVNHYMKSDSKSNGTSAGRRGVRIRAFTWLPPVYSAKGPKWGVHYLMVADDNRTINVLRVSRTPETAPTLWHLQFVQSFPENVWNSARGDTQGMSSLQRKLYEQMPVMGLHVGSWQDDSSSQENEDGKSMFLKLVADCKIISSEAKLFITTAGAGDTTSFAIREATFSYTWPASSDGLTYESHSPELTQSYFKEPLQSVCDDFDSLYQLAGHHRVRFWGTTKSVDGTKAVACVTLHPSDMIEYTIPSAERCTLIFKTIGAISDTRPRDPLSTALVQKAILASACSILRDPTLIQSALDRKILLTFCTLESMIRGPQEDLGSGINAIRETILTQKDHNNAAAEFGSGQNDQQVQGSKQFFDIPESCDICGASIPFTSTDCEAVCASGHQFTRCKVSFVAIQEPGISKYCSQCGNQFLDLSKLGAVEGPCFAQALFDEFDVCPYCQAKFHG